MVSEKSGIVRDKNLVARKIFFFTVSRIVAIQITFLRCHKFSASHFLIIFFFCNVCTKEKL